MNLGKDLSFFELEFWNLQHMLDLEFPEISQSLSSFKQLLFSLFHRGGPKEKNQITVNSPQNLALHFLIGIPFIKNCKKVVMYYIEKNVFVFYSRKIVERGYQIGNKKIDKRGVFVFFSFGLLMK